MSPNTPTSKDPRPEQEQESHESGIVSPLKNEILEEHAKKYPEGDPAVRRTRPSREEAGVRIVKRPKLDPKPDKGTA